MNMACLNDIHFFSINNVQLAYDTVSGTIIKLDESEAKLLRTVASKYTLGRLSLSELNDNEQKLLKDFVELIEASRREKRRNVGEGNLNKELEDRVETLSLIVSHHCNMRCRYCYANSGSFSLHEVKKAYMSYELAKKVVELLKPFGLETVVFYGGEPLLNFGLIEKLVKEYHRELKFSVVTNGTLITEKVATFFARYDVSVTVSLDGPAKVHDLTRIFSNGRPSHSKVLEGILLLKKHGVDFAIEATYSRAYSNLITPRELIEYLSRFSKCLVVTPVLPKGRALKSLDDVLDAKSLLRLFVELVDTVLVRDHDVEEQSIAYHIQSILNPPQRKELYCEKVRRQLCVAADGSVYPCHNGIEECLKLGNVLSSSVHDILCSRARVLREYFVLEKLEPRWYYKMTDICISYIPLKAVEKGLRVPPMFDEVISKFLEYLIFKLAEEYG